MSVNRTVTSRTSRTQRTVVVLINYGSFGCWAIDGCSHRGFGETGIFEFLSGVRSRPLISKLCPSEPGLSTTEIWLDRTSGPASTAVGREADLAWGGFDRLVVGPKADAGSRPNTYFI